VRDYLKQNGYTCPAALGAIVELYEKAIFIRKMLSKGVATQMGLTAGSSITAMWDVNNMDYHMVRIVKQAHSEHFQLNGMLAVQINTSNGNLKSLETDEMHDNSMFRLENGDLVRLSSHEFEEIDANHFHSNIFRFAATEKNKVSIPFSYNCLMALEGPHLILKIVSWTGAQVRLLFFLKRRNSQTQNDTFTTELQRIDFCVAKCGLQVRTSIEFSSEIR
jgi:hypothetical protein